jgi:uncharacterized membrane protein
VGCLRADRGATDIVSANHRQAYVGAYTCFCGCVGSQCAVAAALVSRHPCAGGWPQFDGLLLVGILASGVLNLIATLASTQALKHADASIATPLLSFNPAFALLISVFALREIPSVRGIIGVALIVVRAYLFHIERVGEGLIASVQALMHQPGVLLAVGASFVCGLTPIFEKIAIQHTAPENPLAAAFGTTLLTVVMLFPALLRDAASLRSQVYQQRRGFLAAGLISGIAPLFGFTAIAQGYVGYVTASFKLSALFTVLWSVLLLHERGLRQQLPATMVMALGGLLIAV